MAFDKYKDGAWMEPETGVERYADGAWVDCDSAKRYVDGAWSEVWANIKWLTLLSSNITTGMCTVSDDGLAIDFWKYMDYFENRYFGTISGGGTMVLYLDGEWTNPTISFDYNGGFIRCSTPDSKGTWYCVSAGKVSLYSRTTGGTVETKEVVSRVGETQSGESVEEESGSYEGVLEGTFNRLGLSIYVNGFSGNYYSACLDLNIRNLLINGRKIGFPASVAFDNQEWA